MRFALATRPFGVLFKHFFSRLTTNDLLKFEDQQRESQVTILVFLAVAGLLAAHVAYEPFLLYALYDMAPADLWRYEALLLTFNMAMAGVIAVASWDKLFLDPLDQVNLRPLPLSAGILFSAKFAGLLAFIAAVTMIGNFFPILITAFYPAQMLDSLSGGLAHGVAALLGSLFVFMAVALLQSLFTAFLSPALGRRAGIFAQMLLLLIFLSPFVWFPMLFRSLPALKAGGSAFFHYYPPLWFTGIFSQIIGVGDPLLDRAARSGLLAVTLVLGACLLVFRLCLKKFMRSTQPMTAGSRIASRLPAIRNVLAALFLRHPVQRAVFSFFTQTLRRSREHKLKLTLFLALPISFLLSQFAYVYLRKGFSGGALDSFLIAMPLALHFFLVIGMRMTVAYPHTLPANFIFRASESEPLRHYTNGFKKALFCSVVLPPSAISLLLGLRFWEPMPTVLHALFSLAIALLLLEVCFFNYHKLPFASEHVPGKLKLRYYWPVLVIGFIQYQLLLAGLGKRLRDDPSGYPVYFLLVALLYALLRINQGRRLAGERLVFEEEPEPAMLTLGLD
jgi:hypothetical protein